MFALLGLSGGEIILLLVVGLILTGGLVGVGLVLYFVLRKKKADEPAKPPTLPGK